MAIIKTKEPTLIPTNIPVGLLDCIASVGVEGLEVPVRSMAAGKRLFVNNVCVKKEWWIASIEVCSVEESDRLTVDHGAQKARLLQDQRRRTGLLGSRLYQCTRCLYASRKRVGT